MVLTYLEVWYLIYITILLVRVKASTLVLEIMAMSQKFHFLSVFWSHFFISVFLSVFVLTSSIINIV